MTIHELAREIGVSSTTVSVALSGRGRLSAKTRERVVLEAQARGFTINANARVLATGRTNLIGLEWISLQEMSDIHTVLLIREIQRELAPAGYNLLVRVAEGHQERIELIRNWIGSQAVDGIISLGQIIDLPEMAQEIVASGIPCALVSEVAFDNLPALAATVSDFRPGLKEMCAYLQQQGHRSLGYLSYLEHHSIMLPILHEEARAHGIMIDDSHHIIESDRTLWNGSSLLKKLLKQPHPPTAVFCRNDTLAAEAMRYAHEQGVRIPQDISIVGHDDNPISSLVYPQLTAIRIDKPSMAASVVSQLLKLLETPGTALPRQVVPTSLVIRDSVGPVPPHS